MQMNRRVALTALMSLSLVSAGLVVTDSAQAIAPLEKGTVQVESGTSRVMNLPPAAVNAQLSEAEIVRLKTWLDGRVERQEQREKLGGGDLGYQLTPKEMATVSYLPDTVMEALDLPLAYRNGSRLGFYGGNAVLIVPSSGQLIDVLPDAMGELSSLAQIAN